jgi:hypothetical protein
LGSGVGRKIETAFEEKEAAYAVEFCGSVQRRVSCSCGCHKRQGISWPAKHLLAFKVGTCSQERITFFVWIVVCLSIITDMFFLAVLFPCAIFGAALNVPINVFHGDRGVIFKQLLIQYQITRQTFPVDHVAKTAM